MLGGSRHLSVIPDEVIDNLKTWVREGYEILLGDAKGTDAKFQEFFKHLKYSEVKIFYSGDYVRHNSGNWETIKIDSGLKSKGHALHGAKDREMAQMADTGLMIWDTLSIGTMANVLDLALQGKPCYMYVFSDDMNLYEIRNLLDVEVWESRFPDIFQQANKRLKSHKKRLSKVNKKIDQTLF
jgi:hypothetical protein